MSGMRHVLLRKPETLRHWLLIASVGAALVLAPTIYALRARTNGAGGCGQFSDAVFAAEDGDVITPMFNGNDTARNSEGATITQDIVIEGGWSPPQAGCGSANITYDTPSDMLGAGFTYGGPSNRAELFFFSGPIITIDPAVKNLLIYGTDFLIEDGNSGNGGGIFGGSLSAANIRLDQVDFKPRPFSTADVGGEGGGFYLDVNTGSRVSIDDSSISDITANQGGGFELVVRGGSHVTLNNLTVTGNSADAGRGGGGRIIMHSGYVTITDSLFSNNSASVEGGGLRIERAPGATGPAEVWIVNTRFSGNTAPINADLSVSGDVIVRNLTQPAQLPLVVENVTPGSRINAITRTGNTYLVSFTPVGYTPALPGQHVHFFFDTVSPTQAGVPGAGPWFMYAGSSPFNLWGVANRPFGATRMCILVANADHSVNQATGDCAKLP
jgi:hypothetical protein